MNVKAVLGRVIRVFAVGAVAILVWLAIAGHRTSETTETVRPGESEVIGRLVGAAVQAVDRLAEGGKMVERDAHATAHGCVTGIVTVNQDLDASLQQGIFKEPGRSYQAWIRFSNGTEADDRKNDARGMAIKVMGVSGEKLLAAESDAQTQDFVMIDWPTFFIKDVWNYEEFFAYQVAQKPFSYFVGLNPPRLHPIEMWDAARMYLNSSPNPLASSYYTMTAYKYGHLNVKFSAQSCTPQGYIDGPIDSPDFMRQAMKDQLGKSIGCFDLKVQLQAVEANMPIENPSIPWNQGVSPYVPIGQLIIPQQSFDTPEQNEFCENLSFTPWHALPDHRPLGALNRSRRAVYTAVSTHRHLMNAAARTEPSGWCIQSPSGVCSLPPSDPRE